MILMSIYMTRGKKTKRGCKEKNAKSLLSLSLSLSLIGRVDLLIAMSMFDFCFSLASRIFWIVYDFSHTSSSRVFFALSLASSLLVRLSILWPRIKY